MKLAALVVMLSVAWTARAEAICDTPRWLGTPTGSRIPATGTLYFYSEGLGASTARVVEAKWPAGTTPKWTERRISSNVVAVDYDASTATEVTVGPEHDAVTLKIDRAWVAPAAAPRVIQYWHHKLEWTCSSADSVMLQVDQPTAAFRVRWKFAGKKSREWIVPARASDIRATVLELGKINCGDTTIEPAELAQGGELTLMAIRFDGTEVPVGGLPAVLSTAQMPETSDGVDRAFTMATVTPGEPGDPLEPPMDPRWPAMLFGFGTFIVGSLFFLRNKGRALKSVV